MAGLLGQSVLPPEIQALLLERAGGNPLYAEEFVRLLSDRGLLVRSGRVVRLATTAAIPFLDTVQALIAARLDMLPAGGKALVQDAAVVGRVFWPGALAALAGTAEPAVLAGLAALAARELVQEVRPSSVEGQAEYRFSHGLVKDVAYAQIPRVGRARRHRAVAGWLEGLAGERVADLAEVIAYHSTPRPWPSPGRPAAARPSWPSWPDRPGGPWSWPATAPSPSTWPGPGGSTPRPSSCSRPATRNGTSCCRGSAGSPSRRGGWPTSARRTSRRWPASAPPATGSARATPSTGSRPSSGTRARRPGPGRSSPRRSGCSSRPGRGRSWAKPMPTWPSTG